MLPQVTETDRPYHQGSGQVPSGVSPLFPRDSNASCPLRVVHSSFHGVGHAFVQEAFRNFNLPPPIAVPEQRDPDPDFPSVRCPNPEEGESVLV